MSGAQSNPANKTASLPAPATDGRHGGRPLHTGGQAGRQAGPIAIASFIACGALAQITQILLLRELLVVLDGDELALGVMLGAWLTWVGIGSLVGGLRVCPAGPARRYALALIAATASLPATLLCVRLARPLLGAPLGMPLGLADTLLLALTASAVPCLSVGILFPLMVRQTGARAATVYGWEGVGALAGGLLFMFALVGRAAPLAIAAGAGLLAALTGSCLLAAYGKPTRRWAATLALLSLLLSTLTVLGPQVDRWSESQRWRRLLPRHRLLATRESPYARCSMLESAGQFTLFSDAQLVCDLPDPQAGTFFVHTTLLQHPSPQLVLIATADPASMLREARRHRPQRIDCVTLDPIPLRLLRNHAPADILAATQAPEVHLHETDPVRYLRQTQRGYDAILVDVPDPTTLGLNRFYTREFFTLAAERLNSGGVLAVTVSSQANYMGDELLARNALVYRTLRSVLPNILASPGDTCLLLARRPAPDAKPLTLDAETLEGRRLARDVDSMAYQALLYSDPFPADEVRRVNSELALWPAPAAEPPTPDGSDAEAERRAMSALPRGLINADLSPLAQWATRLLSAQKHEPRHLSRLHALPQAANRVLAACVGVGVLIVIVANLRRRSAAAGRPITVGLTVASGAAGFAGMTLQVLVLLWFQCQAGQVYVGLALLTASFMAGLAIGSLTIGDLAQKRLVLALLQGCLIAASLASPAVLARWTALPQLTGTALAGVLGLVLGAHFACCAGLWPGGRGAAATSARWLYAADLAGAALAALLVTAVVVPAAGFAAAAHWAALLAAVALLATAASTPRLAARGWNPERQRRAT